MGHASILRPLRAVITVAAAMILSACGDDRFPDYRYRMTVEVETPEGLKTGSSVIEVKTKEVSTILDPAGKTYRDQVRGEAVAVDIAPGKTLFALLSRPDDPDFAKKVAFAALKPERISGGDLEGYQKHLVEMTKIEGVHELPRRNWPYFVTFDRLDDPSSIKPANLDQIRSVKIELTNDPVTTHLESKIPWIHTHSGRLTRASFSDPLPQREVAQITDGAFAMGIRDE